MRSICAGRPLPTPAVGWRPGAPLPGHARRRSRPAHVEGCPGRPARHVDGRHRHCALVAAAPAGVHADGVFRRAALPPWHAGGRTAAGAGTAARRLPGPRTYSLRGRTCRRRRSRTPSGGCGSTTPGGARPARAALPAAGRASSQAAHNASALCGRDAPPAACPGRASGAAGRCRPRIARGRRLRGPCPELADAEYLEGKLRDGPL